MTDELKQTVALLLTGEDADQRRQAAEDLAAYDSFLSVAALAAGVKDADKGVRDAAVRSLRTIGGTRSAQAIVEYLNDKEIYVRNFASDLLITLGRTSFPAIIPYLEHDDRDIRKFAVDILGVIGNSEPVHYILPLLNDVDENVVVSAVEALGNIKSTYALKRLCKLYETQPYTRTTVAEAIGKIGDPSASAFLVRELERAVKDAASDPLLPFVMCEALGSTGGVEHGDALRTAAKNLKGKGRYMALVALWRIYERAGERMPDTSDFKESWLQAIRDRDDGVCLAAVHALERCEGDDVTKALLQQLGRADAINDKLLQILIKRTNIFSLVVDEIAQPLSAKTRKIIELAGFLVIEMTRNYKLLPLTGEFDELREHAFNGIMHHWSDADQETRIALVDTLFHLDGDRAEEFLDKIMEDPDPWLRMHVIEVLAAISDQRLPSFIGRFLNDESEMVREIAMLTLEAKGISVQLQ